MTATYPPFNVFALPETQGVDIMGAFAGLAALYDQVDAMMEQTTTDLDLPCHRGCSNCCRESVFLTPLEFYFAWQWAQGELSDEERSEIIDKALTLYDIHRDVIEAFDEPPPEGETDHSLLARELRYDCPMLDEQGACRVYPVREILSRLFGGSFDDEGGIYGCQWVKDHLLGKHVTLLTARTTAQHLQALPLTHQRQVYPYYFHRLYGTTNSELR